MSLSLTRPGDDFGRAVSEHTAVDDYDGRGRSRGQSDDWTPDHLGSRAECRGPSPTRFSQSGLLKELKPPDRPTRFGKLPLQDVALWVRGLIIAMAIGSFVCNGMAYGGHGDPTYKGQVEFLLPVFLTIPLILEVLWCAFDIVLVLSFSRAFNTPPISNYKIRMWIEVFMAVVTLVVTIMLIIHTAVVPTRDTPYNIACSTFFSATLVAMLAEIAIIFLAWQRAKVDPRRLRKRQSEIIALDKDGEGIGMDGRRLKDRDTSKNKAIPPEWDEFQLRA